MESIRIQAKFVVVSSQRILHPGQVVVRNGRVVEVTQSTTAKADVDLGDVVLLPGLVNAHTHLEFSNLRQPFSAGANFPTWIGAVVRHRNANPVSRAQAASTIRQGATECFHSGTALIADIVTQPWSFGDSAFAVDEVADAVDWVRGIPAKHWREHFCGLCLPKVIPFPEMIGLSSLRLKGSIEWATSLLSPEFGLSADASPAIGLSPHAPYSTLYPDIRVATDGISKEFPFAMHVAESLEEREWAADGTGPFRDVFEQLGIELPSQRMQIVDAISMLSDRAQSLLIHGNYLTNNEMDKIGEAGNISVVYCPRTHQHFSHTAYPLSQLRKRGIRVVLGTDSRASNPDLNLWQELVAARNEHPELSPADAFAAITSESAAGLNCEQDYGSLNVGNFAFINVLQCKPELRHSSLLEQLTSQSQEITPLVGQW